MNEQLRRIVEQAEALAGALSPPVSQTLIDEGWTDHTAKRTSGFIDAFVKLTKATGVLPPEGSRLFGLVRGVDFMGVSGGAMVNKLATLEVSITRLAAKADTHKLN